MARGGSTMNEAAQLITALGGLAAVSLVIKTLRDGWQAMRTGRAKRERDRNRDLLARTEAAEAEADTEAAYRRLLAEHASSLRRMLLEAGTPAEDLPPWPNRPKQQ